MTIVRTKKLPKGTVPALEKEFVRRISQNYSDCKLTIRRAGSGGIEGPQKKAVSVPVKSNSMPCTLSLRTDSANITTNPTT